MAKVSHPCCQCIHLKHFLVAVSHNLLFPGLNVVIKLIPGHCNVRLKQVFFDLSNKICLSDFRNDLQRVGAITTGLAHVAIKTPYVS